MCVKTSFLSLWSERVVLLHMMSADRSMAYDKALVRAEAIHEPPGQAR
jgi:hypothetical protein